MIEDLERIKISHETIRKIIREKDLLYKIHRI